MCESPSSLQNICVNGICDNFDLVFKRVLTSDPCKESDKSWLNANESDYEYLFRGDEPQFLPQQVSEYLFEQLVNKSMLNDFTISIFKPENTRLKKIKIKNAKQLSKKGLAILAKHQIVSFEYSKGTIPLAAIKSSLGEKAADNLKYFTISDCDQAEVRSFMLISSFRNLQHLNVAGTDFFTHPLQIICEDLHHLRSINVSNTVVASIEPLVLCKDRLTSLSMYNVIMNCDDRVIPTLAQLTHLTYLDISCNSPRRPFDVVSPFDTINNLLKLEDPLPNLIHLDLSGHSDMNLDLLKSFLMKHEKLKFLGLLLTECCENSIFTNPKNTHYRSDLVISGSANERQILTSLRMYIERPHFTQKSLYHLFRLSASLGQPRPDVIRLVLLGMENHSQQLSVQMAASACLYNLTRSDSATKIHPSLLSSVVNYTMKAMETFTNSQLQKNALLTLCNDRILQDIQFDKFRCALIVIEVLCATQDASMNRMAVAIISILAAKITTDETSFIGSKSVYMSKLINMIMEKVIQNNCDITLKFTLSALWNLTDESSATCAVFLHQGGIELFLQVLSTFTGESSIETKVLGLINNIAEVVELRPQLMIPELLVELKVLLESEHIDVSYFAAGIIAHLANDGPESWQCVDVQREHLLHLLGETVANWKTPDVELVAYRTFRPFFPLLESTSDFQIVYWAVWAIHHVCTKNPQRYCKMLVDEGCDRVLKQISENLLRQQPHLGQLIHEILAILQSRI